MFTRLLDAADKAAADHSFDPKRPINPETGKPITCHVVVRAHSGTSSSQEALGKAPRKVFTDPVSRSEHGAHFCPDTSVPNTPVRRLACSKLQREAVRLASAGRILACRLGKDSEENSRLWNTVKWIDKPFFGLQRCLRKRRKV